MPTIRSYMPPPRENDELVRLNGNISLSDKRVVLSACADDGILNLISAHAFRQTADFIRHYSIVSYDPAKFELLRAFICDRTDPRVVGNTNVVNDTRAAQGVQSTHAPTKSLPSRAGKSSPGRTGLKTGEVKGSND